MRVEQMKHAIAALLLVLSATAALASPESEISAYRKSYGLPAVSVDAALNALAAKQAQAMAASGVMDHSVYAPFTQRISSYGAHAAAENIAMGTRTFSETLAMWKASSGHNANLLMGDARRIGIASATGHGRTYWALILAAPHDSHREKGGFLQVASERDAVSARTEKRGRKSSCSRDPDGMWQKLVCWLNGS